MIGGANRPSGPKPPRAEEAFLGPPVRSVLRASPARPPDRRLLRRGERRDGRFLRLVVIEHHDQLGHHEQILDPLAETTQLDLSAPAPIARVAAHEHADGDRIECLAFRQVQQQPAIAGGRLVEDGLLQLVGLLVAEEAALRRQHHDRSDFLAPYGHCDSFPCPCGAGRRTPMWMRGGPAVTPIRVPRSWRSPAPRWDTRRTPSTAW